MNNSNPADSIVSGAASTNPATASDSEIPIFPVVGIGASAGGIPALKKFFTSTPPDSGMAFVVILHLSPDHESRLAEVLKSSTAMPVTQVHKETVIEPDAIYVVSPNQSLSMVGDTLLVSTTQSFEERRAPIDIFFRTLGESKGAGAIGVILSGAGSDGSSGLRRIREHGGLIIAQDPGEAEYDNMPRNAIATGLVDQVLPVADIAVKLIEYASRFPRIVAAAETVEGYDDSEAGVLRAIFTHLRARTGHDFSNYKRSTILRRIARRVTLLGLPALPDYASFLRKNAGETGALVRDFLISVTNFFRDKDAFAAIEKHVMPRLFDGKGASDHVRIWVAGCATGEEAYSLAMLACEYAATQAEPPAVQVFATDIDTRAIGVAREGFYTDAMVADVSGERLERFFNREPGGYRVRAELRDRVLFAAHNLLKDPPFSRIDLCCCRNVLIYLNRIAQERIAATLRFALVPGGYLFLGSSETIENNADGFVTLDQDQRIFQSSALETAMRGIPATMNAPRCANNADRGFGRPGRMEADPAFPSSTGYAADNEAANPGIAQRRTFADLHLRLLEQYAPPSVVVNEDYEIVHLSEHAGQYLRLAGGEPSHDLLKVVLPELRLELRSSLYQARHARRCVRASALPVMVGGEARLVDLVVRPAAAKPDGQSDLTQGFLLVLFEEAQGDAAPADAVRARSETLMLASADPIAGQLEDELLQVKSQLRSNVEQYEIQAEELKASNEELQAMNEELRSATEEMEMSREELQSVNEELTTVNQELKVTIDELSQANNDFQNLINSTDIGTIFLDRALHIKIFTPRVRDIFNLITADCGRSLLDITSRLPHDGLIADIEHVLATAQPVAHEIQVAGGSWQLMRVLPYRSSENRIDGVVLTFTDLTVRKKNEEALLESKQSLDAALAIAQIGVWRWSPDTGKVALDASALRLFDVDAGIRDTESLLAIVHPDDRPALSAAIEASAREQEPYSVEFRIVRPDTAETRTILSKGGPAAAQRGVGDNANTNAGRAVVGASLDITDRKQAAAAKLHFRALFECAPGLYLVLDPSNFEIVAASDAYLAATLTERTGLIGKSIFESFPDDPDDRNADGVRNLRASLERVKASGHADVMAIQRYPVRVPVSGGVEWEERWWSPINSPVTGPRGEVASIIHRVEDVTAFVLEKRAAGREAEGAAVLESRTEHMEAEIVLRAKDLERANQQLRESENRYRAATRELESLNQQLERRITERTWVAEERLRQLRALAVQLTQAEARERRRIAQVLHDNLQQLLLSAKFGLRTLKSQAPQVDFGPVLESLDESLKASRSLVAELRPPILHHAKLSEALRWLGERARQQQGLAVEVVVFGREPNLDEDTKLLLFQSVRELLLNIAKHAAVDRAQIRVGASRSRWLFVRVSDAGSGFRFADTRARGVDGSGLGLIGIRERIEVLGGSMVVRSTVGQGTRVVLRVPVERRSGKESVYPADLANAPLLRRVADQQGPPPLKRTRILLVDDHTMVRQGLRGLIEEECDMQVVGEAQDGLQAIALAGELVPEVILMDINMPRMDGIEATRRIKAAHPDIRIIGLSMHADAGVMNSMRAAGVSDYVTKDTVSDALCDAIREQVKNKSASG